MTARTDLFQFFTKLNQTILQEERTIEETVPLSQTALRSLKEPSQKEAIELDMCSHFSIDLKDAEGVAKKGAILKQEILELRTFQENLLKCLATNLENATAALSRGTSAKEELKLLEKERAESTHKLEQIKDQILEKEKHWFALCLGLFKTSARYNNATPEERASQEKTIVATLKACLYAP